MIARSTSGRGSPLALTLLLLIAALAVGPDAGSEPLAASAEQGPAANEGQTGGASGELTGGAAQVRDRCGGCHLQSKPGHFARISDIRKTPEGWLMTLFRMEHVHGVRMTQSERDTLVRYLSDTQGLAPSETSGARYALERRPNVQDMVLPGELQTMCARCHSAARIALQRRDAEDWLKHVHWHVAQWPTLEYQQNARDRLWWQTATTEVPAQLGKLFPLHTAAWDDWKHRKHADPAGKWLVHGHEPGRGDYWGTAVISRTGDADYSAVYSLDSSNGLKITGGAKSIVYTGFEWRGTGSLSDREIREVYSLSEDGRSLTGRWFEAEHSEIGGDWTAIRDDSAVIVAVNPSAVRTGSVTRVTVFGSGLDGKVSFGPGTAAKVLSRGVNSIVVELRVEPNAAPGWRNVQIGRTGGERLMAVYDHVDRLEVSPAYAIARLGGGKIDPVAAQFEAVAYADVPGGSGGSDALRIGILPVHWSAEPYNDDAKQADDVRFAGRLDDTGRYHPAVAGPNPERKFSANNAGNLSIVASLEDGNRRISDKAHLIVTVQRWNTPPIY